MNEKRPHKRFFWILVSVLLLLFAACGASQPQTEEVMVEVTRVVSEMVVVEGEPVEVTRVVAMDVDTSAALPEPGVAAMQATPAPTSAASSQTQQRLIIKDGRMILTVLDTETAVNSATQLTVGLGGYVISQNMFDDDQGFKYATMRVAVPVDQFEFALRELRKLGDVTDESSSGEDVTDEYVDLNSRLTNLQATRQRLLDFLEQAQTIDEILEVNEELKSVEEDIAVIQGRVNFLQDRAAFSTIDLTLNPLLPTPTPSPTPTATPLPTPESWLPGNTAQTAVVELENTAANVADFGIFYGILCGPWLLVLLLVIWIIVSVRRWLQRRNTTAPIASAAPQSSIEQPAAEGESNDEA